jgi:hypothetical protein
LSNFTPGVEANVFKKSNLTQLYNDYYNDFQQIEGFVDSTFDSESWVNNDEELKIRNGFMPHIMGYKFITYLCPRG